MMKSRETKAAKKPTFTCTEYFGTEDINELILEPIVEFINESFGRELVYVREPEPAAVIDLTDKNPMPIKPIRKKVPPNEEIPIAQ